MSALDWKFVPAAFARWYCNRQSVKTGDRPWADERRAVLPRVDERGRWRVPDAFERAEEEFYAFQREVEDRRRRILGEDK